MTLSLFPPLLRPPVDLSDDNIIQELTSFAHELLSSSSGKKIPFQWRNSKSLLRKTQIFILVLESLNGCGLVFSFTSLLCFKELYLLLIRSKILLDYCFQSNKMWLLLQNLSISGHFHDLNREMAILLDVLPIDELNLSQDLVEQIQLLKKQLSKSSKMCVDKKDEALRHQFYSFLSEFENGKVPCYDDLVWFFVEGLGISDARACRVEIEFLEKQMMNEEPGLDPSSVILNGFVAVSKYARLLLFRYEEDEVRSNLREMKKVDSLLAAPKDFCCSISLDMMTDPVVVSTGQTYDRSSIVRWMDDGHNVCPKTGQMLTHKLLIPNQALKNLILQWCTENGIALDDNDDDDSSPVVFSKAVLEATKVTAALLVEKLEMGSEDSKGSAAGEIRLMTRKCNEIRGYIGEAGAIQGLCKLLSSPNAVSQQNSVTAILNLSILDKNKCRIMEEDGCLELIVNVLQFGHTSEAKENAAAVLFSLSVVRGYKKQIADSERAIEALLDLLNQGSRRGKKDAVTTLFNLSTHSKNCPRMIECGVVPALVAALEVEGASEEAAAALALIVKQPIGVEAVTKEESVLDSLIGMMRRSTPRGKENAVAALLELCRSGGNVVVEKVVSRPGVASLLQALVCTGTARARRKAASLSRAFQRRDQAVVRYGGAIVVTRDSGHGNEVRLPMSISVQVV